ncbi:hypothetical protein [Streptomyces sp. NBC_01262]|jgi:hypothetical protein|uniref:hypothetical protein n=1 Tax=Streptomyces sp. NBC_01262 TaxID=2903803 RepID=UPI002E351D68|nr:hypothetical protein [Streptomyces sp. NBC_01262]
MRALRILYTWTLRARRPVRLAAALLAGAFWWWAALRLAVTPDRTGPVEGLLAAGGWGLSLIPLHSVTRSESPARVSGRVPGPRTPLRYLPRHGHSAVRAQDLARHER